MSYSHRLLHLFQPKPFRFRARISAPEPPGRFSLRLHLYPPLQVLQTHGRLCHLAPASHSSEELPTGGSLCSTGIPPLHRSYGPLRPPLIFRRFPGVSGYTTSLAPPFSRWDEEGFSSCFACPCPHAVAPTPPEWSAASASVRRPMRPSPARVQARPPGLLTFGATCAFACATAWTLAPIPRMRLSRGFRRLVSRPPALRAPGLWLFPWEVFLLLNTPAFAGRTTGRATCTASGSPVSCIPLRWPLVCLSLGCW